MSLLHGLVRGLGLVAVLELTLRLAELAGVADPVLGLTWVAQGVLAGALAGAALDAAWRRGRRSPRTLVLLAFACLALAAALPSLPDPTALRPTGSLPLDAVLVGLLPGAALALGVSRPATGEPVDPLPVLLGAAAGLALLELALLPRIGFGPSALVLGAPWLALEARGGRRGASAPPPPSRPRAGLLGPLAWAAVAALVLATARPFCLQYLPGTRAGGLVLGLVTLTGLAVGGFVGRVVLRGRRPVVVVGLAALLLPLAVLFARQAFAKAGVASAADGWAWPRPGHRGILVGLAFAWTALGPALLALGLPLAAVGSPRGEGGAAPREPNALLPAALAAGVLAGIAAAERQVLPRLEPVAERLVRRSPLQPLEGLAVHPGGIATRFRTQIYLAVESVAHWHGGPIERGGAWGRLERAEADLPVRTEAAAVAGVLVGPPWPEGDVALPSVARLLVAEPFGGDTPFVLFSTPFQAAGSGGTTTVAVLRELARDGLRWAWCDPRSLTPDGLRTVLATWRAAFPAGELVVLQDTYSGPLLGVRVGGAPFAPSLRDVDLLVLSGPLAERVPDGLARPATLQRPALEWQALPEPSPFPHASAGTIEALRAAVVGDEPGLGALLDGLARHAEAQGVRDFAHTPHERVAVPQAELDAYLAGMRAEPGCAPLVRHLRRVGEVMQRKDELARLLTTMEELTELRPDVADFHRWLGYAYGGLLDFEGAAESFRTALALDPGLHDARAQLASALIELERYDEAVAELRAAWDLDPDDLALGKGLALALDGAGRTTEALETARFVLVSVPDDPDLLAMVERLAGR